MSNFNWGSQLIFLKTTGGHWFRIDRVDAIKDQSSEAGGPLSNIHLANGTIMYTAESPESILNRMWKAGK